MAKEYKKEVEELFILITTLIKQEKDSVKKKKKIEIWEFYSKKIEELRDKKDQDNVFQNLREMAKRLKAI